MIVDTPVIGQSQCCQSSSYHGRWGGGCYSARPKPRPGLPTRPGFGTAAPLPSTHRPEVNGPHTLACDELPPVCDTSGRNRGGEATLARAETESYPIRRPCRSPRVRSQHRYDRLRSYKTHPCGGLDQLACISRHPRRVECGRLAVGRVGHVPDLCVRPHLLARVDARASVRGRYDGIGRNHVDRYDIQLALEVQILPLPKVDERARRPQAPSATLSNRPP